MAAYDSDSDSSLSDLPDGTETGVVLGYAAEDQTFTQPQSEPDGTDTQSQSQSHLGGFSTWLDPAQTPSGSLAQCKVCNGTMSLLLQLSADLRTRFPHDERRLHLFCCRKRACVRKAGSIRAIRETRRVGSVVAPRVGGSAPAGKSSTREDGNGNDKAEKAIGRDLGGMLFGVSSPTSSAPGVNPFSAKGTPTMGAGQSVNPFSSLAPTSSLAAKPAQLPDTESIQPPTDTFASKLKISSDDSPSPQTKRTSRPPAPPTPWPPISSFPTPYPTTPLDSDSEIIYPSDTTNFKARSSGPSKTRYDEDDLDFDTPTTDTHARKVSDANDRKSTEKDSDKELFESTMDTTFQRFCDRLSHNPLQVLRYEFGGTPLLYADNDAVAGYFTKHTATATKGAKVQTTPKQLPRCETCGGKRVFEVQLVPGAISALEDDDDAIGVEEGMEWGTVIVGVCEANCAEAGQVVFREEWIGVQWEERVVRAK